MPIIAKVDKEIVPVGTGFIIHDAGLMMTAAHVLVDAAAKAVRKVNETGKFYNHYELYALHATNEKHPDARHW